MAQPILPLSLQRASGRSLTSQVADQVRELVRTGVLRPGDRLPSIRALAADLPVARAGVEQAYDQLIAEGWLAARRGAGTYVAEIGRLPATLPAVARPAQPAGAVGSTPVGLDTGTPWMDLRHEAGWRRAWRDVSA
ncbi:MAG: winged helix-turn-helix domain-containing protein, partial [Actinomycetota bacterium]|nr:winged helix-turn-helix domain-containing protein [Actinomycetota bacterium]